MEIALDAGERRSPASSLDIYLDELEEELEKRLMLMRGRFYSLADAWEIFESAGGRVTIESDHAYTAWVIVEKDRTVFQEVLG